MHIYAGRHRTGSEIVYAAVVVDGEVTEDIIIKRCRETMRQHKVPTKVFIVGEIHRNGAGKIIKDLLPR